MREKGISRRNLSPDAVGALREGLMARYRRDHDRADELRISEIILRARVRNLLSEARDLDWKARKLEDAAEKTRQEYVAVFGEFPTMLVDFFHAYHGDEAPRDCGVEADRKMHLASCCEHGLGKCTECNFDYHAIPNREAKS